MQPQEKHAMIIAETYPSGAEEWYCPTCGYRFIMQWPPQFKKIMLEEGNPLAIHSGGTGGVQMDAAELKPADTSIPETNEGLAPNSQVDIDEEALDPWLDFLEDIDISSELDKDEPGQE